MAPKADKAQLKLPERMRVKLVLLVKEMVAIGPFRAGWPNYGPLKKAPGIPVDSFHCHLKKKTKPTYVACWSIVNKKDRKIEVFYVGTHEGAPY